MASRETGNRTCFITAPADADTSAVRRVLRQLGFASQDVTSLTRPGSLVHLIRNEIADADVVVAILAGPEVNPNVAYEAGLAQGLGKPVIWVGSNPRHFPFEFSEFPFVYADPANERALSFALEQILPRLSQIPSERRRTPRRPRRDRIALARLAAQIEALRASGSGRKLEELLIEVFRADPVVSVTAEKKSRDTEIDMAAWVDGYDSIVGNPVIIEVKFGALSEPRLLQAESQLSGYLLSSNGKFGLLVYLDRRGRRFPRPGGFLNIVRIDATDLARALEKASLGEVILRERNRLFHGRSPESA